MSKHVMIQKTVTFVVGFAICLGGSSILSPGKLCGQDEFAFPELPLGETSDKPPVEFLAPILKVVDEHNVIISGAFIIDNDHYVTYAGEIDAGSSTTIESRPPRFILEENEVFEIDNVKITNTDECVAKMMEPFRQVEMSALKGRVEWSATVRAPRGFDKRDAVAIVIITLEANSRGIGLLVKQRVAAVFQ